MADEIVYRLLQGSGVQITEDAAARTVEISVPGLSSKVNIGDIVQASEVAQGIIELATIAEVRAGTDTQRAVTPAGLKGAAQSTQNDNTSGRLLKVGAFGLGAQFDRRNQVLVPSDLYGKGTMFGFCDATTLGLSLGSNYYGTVIYNGHWSDSSGFPGISRMFVRGNGIWISHAASASAWTPWVSMYHTGNFDPATKANTSGSYPSLDVGNAATVGGQTAGMLAPPGAIMHFAMSVAPSGWLKANGAAVSRTTYAALFSAIGTVWGAGNGSTTFNLPDLRGHFHRSLDDSRGVDAGRTIGSTQQSQNLLHSHGAIASDVGNHNHGNGNYKYLLMQSGQNTFQSGDNSPGEPDLHFSGEIQPAGAHTHAITVQNQGGPEARPVNTALLACIKY